MILLTGFGPFRDVDDNPSAQLVRAAHGRVAHGHTLHARVLDVAWQGGLDVLRRDPDLSRAHLVLGFGVATERQGVQVERYGTASREGADVRGHTPDTPWPGPARVEATVDVERLARCLDATVSEDAGRYLCNGWMHQIVPHTPAPAAFVHLPAEGMTVRALVRGLSRYLETNRSPRQRDRAAATS